MNRTCKLMRTCLTLHFFYLFHVQARRAAGEELLPEEDNSLFKPVPEPGQLENFLVSNQISTHCDQLNMAATQALQKLYVMEALQKGNL